MYIGLPINEQGDPIDTWIPDEKESRQISLRSNEEWLVFHFKRDNKQVFINSLFEMRNSAVLLGPAELVDEIKQIIETM